MATVSRIGPGNQGQVMTLEEFLAGDYEEGYRYELIDGKLAVSPQPDAPQGVLDRWVNRKLDRFSEERPDVINFVFGKASVFIPGRRGVTNPEPDVAAYHDFPLHLPIAQVRWQDVNPLLVAEVLSADDPAKDLVRNAALYLRVPTIREYWVIDPRPDPDRPRLLVHRRHGRRWRTIEVAFSDVYTTPVLPGFRLVVDPRS